MSILHGTSRWLVWSLMITLSVGWSAAVAAAEEEADDAAAGEAVVTDAGPDPFAVPEGATPEELLEFIQGLAQRNEPLATQQELKNYLDRISTAIGKAADQILATDATDQETVDAIEWKIESLRIRGELGERDAGEKTDAFLAKYADDDRPAVVDAVKKIQGYRKEMEFVNTWMGQLRRMPRLEAAQRAEVMKELVSAIESTDKLFANQLIVAVQYCDLLADSNDPAPAVTAVNKLLPLFRASEDPQIEERIPILEGIGRRLNLPGNPIELEGTYLDGTPLDWDDYQGKVVLVDFWATGCGPCLAEVPNVIEAYREYKDKGFDVLAISLDTDHDDVERVMREANIPWRTLYHPDSATGGWYHPMAAKYGVNGIPRAILVDQEGNVVHMNARGHVLDQELRKLLGEPSADATSAISDDDEKKTAQNGSQ